MARYLVTGGAGFIGSNIIAELIERGERVRVLDNFSTGRRKNIAPFVKHIELIEGDLRDLSTVNQAVEGVDYVLHQGALPSVQRSIDAPLATHAANATGTLNILIAARDLAVRRMVYASSSSIYGDSLTLPKREDMFPAPKSPYAVSKMAGEQYCRAFADVFGLETVCLRYFNVFGPRQDPTSQYSAVIPLFITAMLHGQSPTIYGDGEQSRDFTYVANVVQANLLAVTAPDRAVGQVFNVACGERYTLVDLVATLNDILDTDLEPTHESPRPGDVRHSLADVTAAQEVLGYEPQIDFREGLRRTVRWFEEHQPLRP
jgi:nucleoside-diphosphate-sugar epimerase